MYSRPMMFPLDPDGVLYLLEDEYGNQIGLGTREACQRLLHLITASPLMREPHPVPKAPAKPRAAFLRDTGPVVKTRPGF